MRRVVAARRSSARLVAVAALTLAVTLLAGGEAGARPLARTGPNAASASQAVATVRSVSRTDIWVKRASGGPLKTLVKGDVLYLHDIIAAGPGVEATLALKLPPGLPANTLDLLDFYKQLGSGKPAVGEVVKEFFVAPQSVHTDRTLKLSRTGNFITLTLSP
jgi:hypothetical protein